MKNKYKIVEVEWYDAQTYESYAEEIGDLKKWELLLTHTIGYLIFEDKEKVIVGFVVFGVGEEDKVKYIQMIPKGMIKKIRVLK